MPSSETPPRPPTVHPTALVGDDVRLGDGVTIGPFAIVDTGTTIGADSTVYAHATVRAGSTIGCRVTIHEHSVIGGEPQDLSFDALTRSSVRIGDDVTIREGVTINRPTHEGGATIIEERACLMANSHVAHDCRVGPRSILANNVMLAGHVDVGSDVFLGGGTGIHQFTRIGQGVMVSGNASISYDVPPHTIAAERNGLIGLNLVGLRRRKTCTASITDLKRCFRAVFGSGDVRRNAGRAIEDGIAQTDHGREFLRFCSGGRRGFVRPRR